MIKETFDRLDRWKLGKRVSFLVMISLTVHVFFWAMETTKSAAEVAAVTGPLALLQGYVFNLLQGSGSGAA